MRILFTTLLFAAAATLCAQVIPLNAPNDEGDALRSWEKSQEWQLFQDLDGGFEVLIPAKWEHSVDTVTTEVGDLLYHTYYLNTPPVDTVDNVFYMLSYVEYPEGSLHEDSLELVEELLDASEEEAVARMKGELRFSTKKEIDFHPGRYWRVDYLDGEASMRTQAFVSDNRYYAIQTISRIRSGINDSTQKFFGSLDVY